MEHPWYRERPFAAWWPAGYSRAKKHPGREEYPVIDHSRCSRCSLCFIFCPEGIIARGEEYSMDLDYCKGCGVCAQECPVGAIQMHREA
ncbi:MAG: 4Fe-4S binding protein [Peptococcaceae bacterium]|nr:4Fe-4S binding protein [Peptococcaceae bacterium]